MSPTHTTLIEALRDVSPSVPDSEESPCFISRPSEGRRERYIQVPPTCETVRTRPLSYTRTSGCVSHQPRPERFAEVFLDEIVV